MSTIPQGPPPEFGGPDVGFSAAPAEPRRRGGCASRIVILAATTVLTLAGIGVVVGTGGLEERSVEVLPGDDRLLEPGGVVESRLDADGDRRAHPIATVPGQAVVVEVAPLDGLDTYLRVYDVDGMLVAEDDDGGVGLGSRLEFTPEVAGRHIAEVGAYQDAGHGRYRLILTRTAVVDPAAQVLDEGGMVVDGDAEQSRFPFQASRGSLITITVRADGGFDPVVELLGPDGAQIGRDDDGGAGRDSRLEVRTEAEGLHVAVVSGFGGDTGDFQITVTVVEPAKRELTPSGQ